MEESRQSSVELVGTADHTGSDIQHSLHFTGRHFRRTRQDSVAVINAVMRRMNVRVWPTILYRANAEIAEVDVTSRNSMR